MEIIKKEYTNPKPVLYLYRGMPENTLVSNDFNTAKEITVNTSMNEVATLTFSIPFTIDRKISYDDCEKLVKFENEYYIIKSIDIEDSTTGSIKVTCQHESTELKGVYCTYMDLIGASPQAMFETIMASTMHPINTGYNWGGTDVPNTKLRHLIADEEASVYENLVSMAEIFNGWLEFYTDANEIRWVYLRTQAINNGKFIKKNIDMKTLNITYSSEEIFTRLYPLGATDLVSGEEVNIMGVNPTGKSYIENYSWYLAKGIPASVVDKEAKYQQLKIMREDDYADPKALYDFSVEELAKCSVPQLEATLDMDDLSIYTDSLDEPPKVGYEITCINQDIDFILGCRITSVERNYDNPLETRVTISNFIRYDTVYQNIEHTANNADKVFTGTPDGIYVPASRVLCPGDHVNVQMSLNNHQSLITQTADKIALTVEDLGKAKAEILVQADRITSTVTELGVAESKITQQAGQITSLVTNVNGAYSKITQTASEIRSEVSSATSGLSTRISQTESSITSVATGLDGAWSQIRQTATDITSLVTNSTFDSYKQQTAYDFTQKVSTENYNTFVRQTAYDFTQKVSNTSLGGEVSSIIKQSADSICFAIQSKTNSNVIINSSGMTINGGGLTIYDGGQVMWFDDGIARTNVLSCNELMVYKTERGSNFYNILANMEEAYFPDLGVGTLHVLSEGDFDINGYGLRDYIWKIIDDYCDYRGW